MDLDEIYHGGDFLRAADLQGHAVPVTVEQITVEEFAEDDGKKTTKAVLHFEGKNKALALNKTNYEQIKENIGDPGANGHLWVGKSVVLYPSKTDMRGKIVDCIRVKPAAASENREF